MRMAGFVLAVVMLFAAGSSLAVSEERGEFQYVIADSVLVKYTLRTVFDFWHLTADRDSAYITTVGDLRYNVGGGDVDFNGAGLTGVGGLAIDSITGDLTVTGNATVQGVTTLQDTVHVSGIVITDGSFLTLYDSALDAFCQFSAATNHSRFYSDMVVDSQVTIGDTLAVGTDDPEYFVHVVNDGTYPVLIEGGSSGASYVAVDNNHATAEVGINFWRQGTEYWSIQDSNGTLIIYDADDVANRMSMDGATGNTTFYANVTASGASLFADSLGISGDASVTGNFVTDMVAPSYNFATASMVTGGADSIVVDFDPDLPDLAAGATIEFVAEAANTGNADIYVDGTQKNIFEAHDVSELEAGDIPNGGYVVLKYDGTQFQQVSPSGN